MEKWVNGQPYPLETGDSLIVESGRTHHTAELKESSELFAFNFDVDMVEIRSLFQLIGDPFIPSHLKIKDNGIVISQWINDFIEEFKIPLEEHANTTTASMDKQLDQSVRLLRMQMRILDFICMLTEFFKHESDIHINNQVSPAQISLAQKIASQLEQHVGQRSPFQELSNQLGFHRSHLSNCFKSVYGISPQEYWNHIRIRSARHLLQNTDLTMELIAEKLDFSSPAHFSSFFQKHVGLSPLKFRNFYLAGKTNVVTFWSAKDNPGTNTAVVIADE